MAWRAGPGVVVLAIALALAAGGALAHQALSGWTYPVSCCSEADCAEVSPSAVTETEKGYVVVVRPGTHPQWGNGHPSPLVVSVPYTKRQTSPDGHYHLCINGAGSLLCFFAATGGS